MSKSSQNLADSMVSVTKLCCPVCCELFQVLRRGEQVQVCGCHPTITPTVLPETLPNEVSKVMVIHFQAHLSGQLHHLLSIRIIQFFLADLISLFANKPAKLL